MVVTLGQQYNVGEKPTVILYTYNIQRIGCQPEKTIYTVANPARGLLNRGENNKRKSLAAHLPTLHAALMYVCMVITYSRVWINRVRLPIVLVVS